MITLDEYKKHLIGVYSWPLDNNEIEIEKRKDYLKKFYSDEYLEKIINDTYLFVKEVLTSDSFNNMYYVKDVEEDTTKSIDLFLHGGCNSDVLFVDDDGKIISRYIIRQIFGDYIHIEIECEELEDNRNDDILSYYYRYYIYIQNFPSNVDEIKDSLLCEKEPVKALKLGIDDLKRC